MDIAIDLKCRICGGDLDGSVKMAGTTIYITVDKPCPRCVKTSMALSQVLGEDIGSEEGYKRGYDEGYEDGLTEYITGGD